MNNDRMNMWKTFDPERRDVFLSFSFLLIMASSDLVPQGALDNGLFAFQATRVVAFDDEYSRTEIDGLCDEEEAAQRWKVLREVLRPAILRAEQEHRVLWRERGGWLGFRDINTFLENHGYTGAIDYKLLHEKLPAYAIERGDEFSPYLAREVYDATQLKLWIA